MVVLGAAIYLCALAAPPVDASSVGTGRIEGEIVAPGGAPLAEVWACAYLVQNEELEEHCAFTASDGIYAIKGLKAGMYKVEFWPEATEPSYVGEFYEDERYWEDADEVEVDEGTATTGIDAELAEGATIKGEVRAASLGGPVKHAIVCAKLPTYKLEGCARVQSDGTYALFGLPADEYIIEFVPASNLYNLLNQYYDHRPTPAQADLLAVAAGETKIGIDADLEAGAEIQGTVYSAASGAPVSWVQVCALFYEEVLESWLPRMCGPTSGTGSFALFGLDTNSYKVAFSPDLSEFFGEEAGGEDGYFTQYFDDRPSLATADLVSLTAPEVRTGLDAYLQPKPIASFPASPILPPPISTPAPRRKVALRCRPGFRKKKIGGKRRCLKVRKHKRRNRDQGKQA